MYLNKVMVNWRWARDPYQLHRALWQLFPDLPQAKREFLFRTEHQQPGTGALLLLQSALPPVDAPVAHIIASKPFEPVLNVQQSLRFRLRANVVKTIKDAHGRLDSAGNPKRCRVPLIKEEEQLQWLQRKLNEAALLKQACVMPEKPMFFEKANMGGKILPVSFEGVLTITDPLRFIQILQTGIGPAKALGCGLLSIAPL
ncbi:type I-E CRISPR-associated protein Cas6/Cse3/CasE [Cronobacter dublinensis]|uniref:type I-E CRISPR-associated protein Cas6/Cse3/CasE n=1 Tax=Cronobacter dublinensis TaxID=413497 RepID=UPI00300DEF90